MHSKPRMAVYGQHPTQPSSSRVRSRMEMLTQMRQPPVAGYATSTTHPSSSRMDRSGTLPPDHLVDTMTPEEVSHLYGPATGQGIPTSTRHKDAVGAYSQYVDNLREQVNVLEHQTALYEKDRMMKGAGGLTPSQLHLNPQMLQREGDSASKRVVGRVPRTPTEHLLAPSPGARATSAVGAGRAGYGGAVHQAGGVHKRSPIVETHASNILEGLQQEATMAKAEADASRREFEALQKDQDILRQELHSARQIAAHQRSAAQAAQKERDVAVDDRQSYQRNLQETTQTVEQLQRRFDFAMEELNSVKRELDVARLAGRAAKEVEKQQAVEAEPLLAQIEELREQLRNKDTRIEELLEANERLTQDQSKAFHSLRHEEQKVQLLTAEKESAKVLQRDAESECQLLRTENGTLKEEVERLSARCTDLAQRYQVELETRAARENRANHSQEVVKQLQQELAQTQSCYMAEKGMNEEIRADLESYRRLSDDLRRQLASSHERFRQLQENLSHLEGTYRASVAQLEASTQMIQQAHQSQLAEETRQIKATMNLVGQMKQDIDALSKTSAAVTQGQDPALTGTATGRTSPSREGEKRDRSREIEEIIRSAALGNRSTSQGLAPEAHRLSPSHRTVDLGADHSHQAKPKSSLTSPKRSQSPVRTRPILTPPSHPLHTSEEYFTRRDRERDREWDAKSSLELEVAEIRRKEESDRMNAQIIYQEALKAMRTPSALLPQPVHQPSSSSASPQEPVKPEATFIKAASQPTTSGEGAKKSVSPSRK